MGESFAGQCKPAQAAPVIHGQAQLDAGGLGDDRIVIHPIMGESV